MHSRLQFLANSRIFLNKSRVEEFYNVPCADLGQIESLKSRELSKRKILKSCNYLSVNFFAIYFELVSQDELEFNQLISLEPLLNFPTCFR